MGWPGLNRSGPIVGCLDRLNNTHAVALLNLPGSATPQLHGLATHGLKKLPDRSLATLPPTEEVLYIPTRLWEVACTRSVVGTGTGTAIPYCLLIVDRDGCGQVYLGGIDRREIASGANGFRRL